MCSSKYVVLSVYLKKKWFETNVVFFEERWESWDVTIEPCDSLNCDHSGCQSTTPLLQ